jgi:hypothetical protein
VCALFLLRQKTLLFATPSGEIRNEKLKTASSPPPVGGSAEAAVPATAARRPARRDRRKSVMLAFLPAGGLGAASLANR